MKTKPMRVPIEFEGWIDTLSNEFSRQTGLPKNNTATMRRMGLKLRDKIVVKGIDFDWAIWKRRKNEG